MRGGDDNPNIKEIVANAEKLVVNPSNFLRYTPSNQTKFKRAQHELVATGSLDPVIQELETMPPSKPLIPLGRTRATSATNPTTSTSPISNISRRARAATEGAVSTASTAASTVGNFFSSLFRTNPADGPTRGGKRTHKKRKHHKKRHSKTVKRRHH